MLGGCCEVFVLQRKLILLFRNCHHDEISGNSYLRLGWDRWSAEITHVGSLVQSNLVFLAHDWTVNQVWWTLGSHCHATGSHFKIGRRDRSNLLSLHGVRVCDYTFAHLAFCCLNRVRCYFILQERPNDLAHLLEVVGSHFLDQLLVLGISLDSPQRLLRLGGETRHLQGILTFALRLHDWIEHSVRLVRSFN